MSAVEPEERQTTVTVELRRVGPRCGNTLEESADRVRAEPVTSLDDCAGGDLAIT